MLLATLEMTHHAYRDPEPIIVAPRRHTALPGFMTWSVGAEAAVRPLLPVGGDPLEYETVFRRLRSSGRVDKDGFADEDDWFLETVSSEYPDGLRRLIHSLTGTYVDNYATVICSLKPGFAWGWTSANLSSKLSGGRLEGTHGGLDADSTVGFFMTDDPDYQPATAVRAEQALAPFAGMNDCLIVADDDAYVRSVAVNELKVLAGKDFGYDPRAPEAERSEAVRRWEAWP